MPPNDENTVVTSSHWRPRYRQFIESNQYALYFSAFVGASFIGTRMWFRYAAKALAFNRLDTRAKYPVCWAVASYKAEPLYRYRLPFYNAPEYMSLDDYCNMSRQCFSEENVALSSQEIHHILKKLKIPYQQLDIHQNNSVLPLFDWSKKQTVIPKASGVYLIDLKAKKGAMGHYMTAVVEGNKVMLLDRDGTVFHNYFLLSQLNVFPQIESSKFKYDYRGNTVERLLSEQWQIAGVTHLPFCRLTNTIRAIGMIGWSILFVNLLILMDYYVFTPDETNRLKYDDKCYPLSKDKASSM